MCGAASWPGRRLVDLGILRGAAGAVVRGACVPRAFACWVSYVCAPARVSLIGKLTHALTKSKLMLTRHTHQTRSKTLPRASVRAVRPNLPRVYRALPLWCLELGIAIGICSFLLVQRARGLKNRYIHTAIPPAALQHVHKVCASHFPAPPTPRETGYGTLRQSITGDETFIFF